MALRYSTGCVRLYASSGCLGADLPLSILAGQNFRYYYDLAGFERVTTWEDENVWGNDFREGTDLVPNGGSDVPEVYFFKGHGDCEDPPTETSDDFIFVCARLDNASAGANAVIIGEQTTWGDGDGNLQFLFLDASCSMDLPELGHTWFPCFQGLHMAVGHTGDRQPPYGHDIVDSATRAAQFAGYTIGIWPFPKLGVGDAWMVSGLIGVQIEGGVSAVALAAGDDRDDAIDRRENEMVTDNRPKPTPNWFAWKWVTRPKS